MNYDPGDYLYVWANQGDREAHVLAVIGDETLIEYEMPKGTTALRILGPEQDKNVSYMRLTKKWLRAIVEAGTEWIGYPQQWRREGKPILDRENLRVIASGEINSFPKYSISKDQQEALNALQDVLNKLDYDRSKTQLAYPTNEFLITSVINAAGGDKAGVFRWEEDDPGDAYPWYCDECHTWHTTNYNQTIGRDDIGRRYVIIYAGDQDGNWEYDLGWDERAGDTPETFDKMADFLGSTSFRYFKAWAEYYIWMAENGKDPLKEWSKPLSITRWFWDNFNSALENVSCAVKALNVV